MEVKNLRLLVLVMGMCLVTTVLLILIVFLTVNSKNQDKRIADLEKQITAEQNINNSDDEDTTIPVSETFGSEWIVNSKIDLAETDLYRVDITYPELINPNNPVVAAGINSYISSLLLNYKQDVTAGETMEGVQNTIELNFDLKYLNDKYVSILVSGSNYLGGAHSNGVYFSINYDLQNNRPLIINDLFNSSSGYLTVLSEKSIAELVARFGDEIPEDFITGGAGAVADNFRVFNITDTALVITFPEYQVAPYAYGPQTVELDLAQFSSLFNSEFAALL